MGSGFVNEEATKVEHSIVLLVIAAVVIHVFSKYAVVTIDTTAFAVFAAMCFAGYFALKTAQEIVASIEERKQAAYETLKAEAFIVSPAALKNHSRYSKYSTSTYSKI